MNEDFINVITQLLHELSLNAGMFFLDENNIATLESQKVILARKSNSGDYFLLAEIKASELNSVNRDLQVSLMSQLNSLLSDARGDGLQPLNEMSQLKIDSSFEKNTTLLLFVKKEGDINELLTKITEVEEDEYFFKKQVVLLHTDFLKNLAGKSAKSPTFKITKYLQETMSDAGKFRKFIEKPNNDTDYAGCAQFFEKLPFLHFGIPSYEPSSLQGMIDNTVLSKKKEYGFVQGNEKDKDESASPILVKKLGEIVSVALEYSSDSSGDDLGIERLLMNVQGN